MSTTLVHTCTITTMESGHGVKVHETRCTCTWFFRDTSINETLIAAVQHELKTMPEDITRWKEEMQ